MTLGIVFGYLCFLLVLGIVCGRLLRLTSGDFFLASRSIGSFMLLMSIFGTTMTAFALIGSTGKTFKVGIGVYGLMASWSSIIHSAIFFLVGAKIWAIGKRHGYLTQISYFRDRYQSDALALILFPLMVGFVLLYILMGVIGSGRFLEALTPETWNMEHIQTSASLSIFPEDVRLNESWRKRLAYDNKTKMMVLTGSIAPKWRPYLLNKSKSIGWKKAINEIFKKAPSGALPKKVGMAIICLVVLFYVFWGGMRATAWANTLQTLIFMITGIVAFYVITKAMGDSDSDSLITAAVKATKKLIDSPGANRMAREGLIEKLEFTSYFFIPFSVGMFPHLFQHWLTARRAKDFKLTVVLHPICIMITWVPCVLIGMWAAGALPLSAPPNAILGIMVSKFSSSPVLGGIIGAGVLAAIMSSMDSQFLCLSSMFTNDIVLRYFETKNLSEAKRVWLGRCFVIGIVLICYLIGLFNSQSIFDLGVWCFSGFASLFPLVFASIYWKRSNREGAIATALTVAFLWLAFLPKVLNKQPGHEFLIGGMMPVTILFVASTVVMVVVTLVTPPPGKEIVERFFPEKNS